MFTPAFPGPQGAQTACLSQITESKLHSIQRRLERIRNRIADAAEQCGRDPASVNLLAVSKTKTARAIIEASQCGQLDFGENYLQEATAKIAELAHLDLTWHFIGAIQSNKTKAIARDFDWVHTLDRQRIADRLARHRSDLGTPPLNVLIQVNIDADAAKAGVAPEETEALVSYTEQLPGLAVRGLMTILERGGNPRDSYLRMHNLFTDLGARRSPGWDTLSMGMSADMEDAIACGATCVRIGTDIFGPREPRSARLVKS